MFQPITQLIIEGDVLPETSHDKYRCYPDLLSAKLEMISGRMVSEVRGTVWRIAYAYDEMDNALCRRLLAVLRSGGPFAAVALPDDRDDMISGTFVVESLTNPTFAFSEGGRPVWHNLAFTLREERPHD